MTLCCRRICFDGPACLASQETQGVLANCLALACLLWVSCKQHDERWIGGFSEALRPAALWGCPTESHGGYQGLGCCRNWVPFWFNAHLMFWCVLLIAASKELRGLDFALQGWDVCAGGISLCPSCFLPHRVTKQVGGDSPFPTIFSWWILLWTSILCHWTKKGNLYKCKVKTLSPAIFENLPVIMHPCCGTLA